MVGFQSTRPARDATWSIPARCSIVYGFQSTRPARDATSPCRSAFDGFVVSIHAPRAGRDGGLIGPGTSTFGFNPRAPRGTRPGTAWFRWSFHGRFNPRAPRGTRPARRPLDFRTSGLFQSTRPARDATRLVRAGDNPVVVSIHAPRAGRDGSPASRRSRGSCFNPRAPRGTRPRSARTVRSQ